MANSKGLPRSSMSSAQVGGSCCSCSSYQPFHSSNLRKGIMCQARRTSGHYLQMSEPRERIVAPWLLKHAQKGAQVEPRLLH